MKTRTLVVAAALFGTVAAGGPVAVVAHAHVCATCHNSGPGDGSRVAIRHINIKGEK